MNYVRVWVAKYFVNAKEINYYRFYYYYYVKYNKVFILYFLFYLLKLVLGYNWVVVMDQLWNFPS